MIKHRNSRGNIVSVESAEDRFWVKVDKHGPVLRPELGPCWVWCSTVSKMRGGYGLFKLISGKQVRAHRQAYTMAVGPIPDRAFVCHRCDNPVCVRPGHLFIGDASINAKDRDAKDRGPVGDRAGRVQHPERYRSMAGVPKPWLAGDAHWTRQRTHCVLRGEKLTWAKLTEEKVRLIRARCAAGESQERVASDFGVGQTSVSGIVRRRSWKHVV